MADKNLHGGHRKRLRDRAMSEGLSAFNPHQILELLLFYAVPRQDTSETAHLLINKFGSVHAVLNAPEKELVQVPGVGSKVALWLRSAGALVGAYGDLRAADRPTIRNVGEMLKYCVEAKRFCKERNVYQICTTPSGVVQIFSHLCDSLAWGEPEALRRSLEDVIAVKARSVVIAEYVDCDKPKVEEYDRQSAEKYARTLGAMGAELLDVVLIGRSEQLSMYKSGDYDRSKFGAARSTFAENYLREDGEPEDGGELPETEYGL